MLQKKLYERSAFGFFFTILNESELFLLLPINGEVELEKKENTLKYAEIRYGRGNDIEIHKPIREIRIRPTFFHFEIIYQIRRENMMNLSNYTLFFIYQRYRFKMYYLPSMLVSG